MTKPRAHGPLAIFDIEHGRRLHRLRPDLAQGDSDRVCGQSSKAPRRFHDLDLLWEGSAGGAHDGARRQRRPAPTAQPRSKARPK